MENTQNKEILSVKDVAKRLNIGINGAYALVREHRIHSVRIGRQYRIPAKALEAYLSSDGGRADKVG